MTTRMLLILLLAICFPSDFAYPQTFCALRDPVRMIYEMYPDATGYRSSVKTIDSDTSVKVRDLVGIALHGEELGRLNQTALFAGGTGDAVLLVENIDRDWNHLVTHELCSIDLR